MNVKAYERITERIIALLEQGTVPWHKPWRVKTSLPRNLVTQKPYRGINVFLLMAMSYESPHWLTFRQAIQLRLYHVFNAAQCDGLKEAPAVENGSYASTKPAEIVAKMPQPPAIKHGMAQAFYSPTDDCIGMPERERFNGEAGYYATLFHELVHATGHEKRLKRASIAERNGFGSDPYCKEELIAELGSAFLCGYADIVDRTIDNSAAYLEGWLKQFQSDRTLIVYAAAQAQKAADFILDRTFAESEVAHD
jgi:antirestriction protein ArdC